MTGQPRRVGRAVHALDPDICGYGQPSSPHFLRFEDVGLDGGEDGTELGGGLVDDEDEEDGGGDEKPVLMLKVGTGDENDDDELDDTGVVAACVDGAGVPSGP